MRDAENIRAAEALGPDMMGFILWERSPRHVAEVPAYLPACTRVGVFVDAPVAYIAEQAKAMGLNRIQLHGHETPEFCQEVHRATGLPITKAISVRTPEDIALHRAYDDLPAVDLYLFDTKCTCVGGSGEQFDWDVLQHYQGEKPFLLAGGIGPDDADRLRTFHHPRMAGIDLNSRFETAPAQKDIALLDSFLRNLRGLPTSPNK